MHAAPAVSVTGSGGLPWRLTQALLPAVAVWAVGGWALQLAELTSAWAAPLALLFFVACWWLARPQPVELRFDGATWSADGRPGAIEVLIDLGSMLLLRWRPLAGRRARYLALTAAEVGPAMHGLRVALYAPPSVSPALPPAGR